MSGSEPRIVKRMDNVRDCTVSELIDWCVERDLSPLDARITAAHIKWESPETDAERERREEWERQKAESMVRWERAQWEKLREKYGG